MSDDGTKVIAGASYPFTSIDSGTTWTSHTSLPSGSWYGATTSADGSIIYIARNNDYIYKGNYD